MNLLSLKFWFAVSPDPLQAMSFKILLGIFSVFVLVGIVGKIVSKKNKNFFAMSRIARRLGRPFISTGLVGLIFLFFESQRVTFLSSRFWYILLLAWFVYALVRFFQYVVTKLPKEREESEKKSRLEKYLPK